MSATVQPSLWDHLATPPTTGDGMSRAAARSIDPLAGTLRRSVAEYVAAHGPIAEYAIEEGLALRGNTVRPRLWELESAHLVIKEGRGITPSGRACHLYAITDLGRRVIELEA